jgi:hypothetical protein
VNQLASVLLQDHLLPARIEQIHSGLEAGPLLCHDCQGQLQLHKHDQQIHPKTIFGREMTLSRSQYFCPDCHTYTIEKGNDLIVVGRMKEGLMYWTRKGADPVIKHRTTFINRGSKTRTGPYDLAFCREATQ